jgi:hypothetical protein
MRPHERDLLVALIKRTDEQWSREEVLAPRMSGTMNKVTIPHSNSQKRATGDRRK